AGGASGVGRGGGAAPAPGVFSALTPTQAGGSGRAFGGPDGRLPAAGPPGHTLWGGDPRSGPPAFTLRGGTRAGPAGGRRARRRWRGRGEPGRGGEAGGPGRAGRRPALRVPEWGGRGRRLHPGGVGVGGGQQRRGLKGVGRGGEGGPELDFSPRRSEGPGLR